MEYDFTTKIDRRGHDALAVDAIGLSGCPGTPRPGWDFIPLWVADMNFATAPEIVEALKARLDHPLFGYFRPTEEYFEAICSWQERRNGVKGLTKAQIGYENGVVGGVLSALRVLANPGDAILVHSPTYVGFNTHIPGAGYRLIPSPLTIDSKGGWRMDYADMEEKIKTYKIHTAVLCSPHNPSGRVWTKAELKEAMELFEKYDVYVISDEIWSDLIYPPHSFVPSHQVNAYAKTHTVSFYAPTKTFNLAGIAGSYHVSFNPRLHDQIVAVGARTGYNHMNVMAHHALIAGYTKGEPWLTALLKVLGENAALGHRYVEETWTGVTSALPEGTYMMFLDCEAWCKAHQKSLDELLRQGWDYGIGWQDGRDFGAPWSIRLNLASPTSVLQEGFDRMTNQVFQVVG